MNVDLKKKTSPLVFDFISSKELIKIIYRGKEIYFVDKSIFLLLHKICDDRGMLERNKETKKLTNPGIVQKIKNGEVDEIHFSKIKSIFKDKYIYLFFHKKIIKDFLNVKFDECDLVGSRGNSYPLKRMKVIISMWIKNIHAQRHTDSVKNFSFDIKKYRNSPSQSNYVLRCIESISNV